MKKFAFLFLTLPFFLLSCGDDNEPTTEYKNVTVEIERNSEFLSSLGESNAFTVSTQTVYNQSDWTTIVPNDGKVILYEMDNDLAPKLTFKFKQQKVDFQLISIYSILEDANVDGDNIKFETKVTIKVNDKVVKTETFSFGVIPQIITYSE